MDKATALQALAALGQETRLEVFRLLVRAGAKGVPAGEIQVRRRILNLRFLGQDEALAVEPGLAVRRLRHDLPQPPQDDAQRGL